MLTDQNKIRFILLTHAGQMQAYQRKGHELPDYCTCTQALLSSFENYLLAYGNSTIQLTHV